MKEYKDASNRLSIELAATDSDILFQKFAQALSSEFNGQLAEKLDGLDQRYWDFDINGTTIVLHSDVFTGISVHVQDGSNDKLLRQIGKRLSSF